MPNIQTTLSPEATLEAILIAVGGAVPKRELARRLGWEHETLKNAIGELRTALMGRGSVLVETPDDLALGSAPEAADAVRAYFGREESGPALSRAAAETLAVILYAGEGRGASRSTVDFIRGVSSAHVLRDLLARGLVERTMEGGGYVYRGAPDLAAHLGVGSWDELPDRDRFANELAAALGDGRETLV